MKPLTTDQKLKLLRKEAKKRGLKIAVDKRLNNTPYRAAHPKSDKYVNDIVVRKNAITVAPFVARNKKKMAMDVNHELFEFDKAKKGWGYKKAHTYANRKQRNFKWLVK